MLLGIIMHRNIFSIFGGMFHRNTYNTVSEYRYLSCWQYLDKMYIHLYVPMNRADLAPNKVCFRKTRPLPPTCSTARITHALLVKQTRLGRANKNQNNILIPNLKAIYEIGCKPTSNLRHLSRLALRPEFHRAPDFNFGKRGVRLPNEYVLYLFS